MDTLEEMRVYRRQYALRCRRAAAKQSNEWYEYELSEYVPAPQYDSVERLVTQAEYVSELSARWDY